MSEVRRELSPFVGSYVDAVAGEAARMRRAQEAVRRAEPWDEPPPDEASACWERRSSFPRSRQVRAVAWLSELHERLFERLDGMGPDAEEPRPRVTANDSGIFWSGRMLSDPAAARNGLHVDVLVPHRTATATVAIKAGPGADRAWSARVAASPRGRAAAR